MTDYIFNISRDGVINNIHYYYFFILVFTHFYCIYQKNFFFKARSSLIKQNTDSRRECGCAPLLSSQQRNFYFEDLILPVILMHHIIAAFLPSTCWISQYPFCCPHVSLSKYFKSNGAFLPLSQASEWH